MCTLIVARDLPISSEANARADLLVGANRDEQLQRPAEPPAIRSAGETRILAPRDKQAGGTWLGLNEYGVFAGLTNRYASPYDAECRSRGELVLEALDAATARAAAQRVAQLDGSQWNGFHLICADADQMFLLWGGPTPIVMSRVGTSVAVITERSLGAARDPRKRATARRLHDARRQERLGPEYLKQLLSASGDDRATDLCIRMEAFHYGTRSSTVLEVGETPRAWHAEGPPCEIPYDDISASLRELLGA